MKPSLYLETTIVSYYCSRPSRDIVISARQQLTQMWWENKIDDYDIYISDLVQDEASKGDKDASVKRLETISKFEILEVDAEASRVAKLLVSEGAIPTVYPEDAVHIGVAAVNGINYILTWNFTHIHNATKQEKIEQIVDLCGYVCPVICTPEELLGG
jgi:predicted nucleic acid-binding protein